MRKRILILFILLCTTCLSVSTAFATDVTLIDGGHWKWVVIETEQTQVVDTVIIYFHGSGNTGSTLNSLKTLMGQSAADGPVKYATTIENEWLPAGVVIVCPQAHDDNDFHRNTNAVFELIEEQAIAYPGAKIILAGHSNGAMMLFNLAYNYPDIVDGWVFISGKSTNGDHLDSDMTNVMVASGIGELHAKIGLARRSDFDNLFYSELETNISAWREEDSNNAYVVGDWTHGQTPRIFLEDFFWDWIKDI